MVKVEMYVTSSCGYCTRARSLLAAKGAVWEERDITRDVRLVEEMVQRSGGRTTVPQIFIGDRHVGGYTDLQALDAAGALDGLLRAPWG